MKTILVTGSEGSLGRFIVNELKKNPEYQIIRVAHHRRHSDDTIICEEGDLTDIDFCEKLSRLYSPDIIIHCAAIWTGFTFDLYIADTNISITANLVRAFKATEHFVYISSSGVYSDSQMEDIDLSMPDNTYGFSKLVSEQFVKISANSGHNRSYTIWRPFHIVSPLEEYGPPSSHICTDILYKLKSRYMSVDFDDLSKNPTVPATWVGDAAECIVNNLDNDKAKNQIFNIGSSEVVSPYQIGAMIYNAALSMNVISSNDGKISYRKNMPCLDPRFEKIRLIWGWTSKTSFKECIDKFVKYKENIS